jgi:hypothetical protein
MITQKFLIKFISASGMDTQSFEVRSHDNMAAVQAYANAILAQGTYTKAEVYPADVQPLMTVTNDKYNLVETPTGCCGGKCKCKQEQENETGVYSFDTTESTWIDSVQWNNGIMTIFFRDGRETSYEANNETFIFFRDYVEAGGSAGRYYNENIKGHLYSL